MKNRLTTEQVLLLNNLMYMSNKEPLSNIENFEGSTVGDMLNVIDVSALDKSRDYGNFMTGEDWQNLIQAIRSDEQLMRIQIARFCRDEKDGASVLFVAPSANEAVVTFRGTGSREWADNFEGGGPTNRPDGVSTAQQEKALGWYQSLELDSYDTVTVTGHSKGGNKAKYITVRDSSVNRCLSFNGQGFSDEFMAEYKDEIAMNQSKIQNHNVENDYVNLLLNDIGETTFYKGQNIGSGGFAENHCPNTFFKFEDGKVSMVLGKRDENMAAVDEFLNSYLRSLSQKEKKKALHLTGQLVEGAFHDMSPDGMIDLLLDAENSEIVTDLLTYLLRYQGEYPKIKEVLEHVMGELDMEGAVKVVEIVTGIMNSEWGSEIVELISGLGEKYIPNWLLEKLAEYIKSQWGVDLSKEELRRICRMIHEIAGNVENPIVDRIRWYVV